MIHYHGAGIGSPTALFETMRGGHALITWKLINQPVIESVLDICQSFMLDNGAFSAWRSQKPITDWTKYYEWVYGKSKVPSFDFAVIRDIIDGDEEDKDALLNEWPHSEYMGAPVWHLHESLQRLERLVVTWPRVAFGSSGKWQTPGTQDWWDRMGEAMAVACDEHGRPRCKLHGLRILHPAIFGEIPLASADSTNAARNANSYGRFGMYCPPHRSTRLNNIAKRIEIHQSPAIWRPRAKQGVLIFTDCEDADQ